MARAKDTKTDEPAAEPEPEVTEEQAEQLGAGRHEDKDRTEREPAEPDNSPGFDSSGTPSQVALDEVGNLDGEDIEPDEVEAALAHGEAYQAAKRKVRWG